MVRKKQLISAALSISSLAAMAAPTCDCTASGWIGECSATLEIKGTWVKVRTNAQQCSRVDWFIDSERISQMTVVLDGIEVEDISPRKPKSVVVQSCKVCKDNRIQRPSQSESNIPPSQNNQRQQAISKIAGTWTGTAQNSLGYTQQIVLRISQTQSKQIQVTQEGKTSEMSWSDSGEGNIDGQVARYSFQGGAVSCSATLVSDAQMRTECSGYGTSSTGTLTNTNTTNTQSQISVGNASEAVGRNEGGNSSWKHGDSQPPLHEQANASAQGNNNSPPRPKYVSKDATHCVEIVPNGFKCDGPYDRFLTNICMTKISVRWRLGSEPWGMKELAPKGCTPVSPFRDQRGVQFKACAWDPKASHGPYADPCRY